VSNLLDLFFSLLSVSTFTYLFPIQDSQDYILYNSFVFITITCMFRFVSNTKCMAACAATLFLKKRQQEIYHIFYSTREQ
jgi:hypothetical protein